MYLIFVFHSGNDSISFSSSVAKSLFKSLFPRIVCHVQGIKKEEICPNHDMFICYILVLILSSLIAY